MLATPCQSAGQEGYTLINEAESADSVLGVTRVRKVRGSGGILLFRPGNVSKCVQWIPKSLSTLLYPAHVCCVKCANEAVYLMYKLSHNHF